MSPIDSAAAAGFAIGLYVLHDTPALGLSLSKPLSTSTGSVRQGVMDCVKLNWHNDCPKSEALP
jgi:hypothetical protein